MIKEIFYSLIKIGLILLGITSSTLTAYAQLQFEITGVSANKIPITIINFTGEQTISQKITEIIKTDLAYTGIFTPIHISHLSQNINNINFMHSKYHDADLLVFGNIHDSTVDHLEVHYHLFDNVKRKELSALAFSSKSQLIRLIAHKIADDIYIKLTGICGIFSTHIAYVTHDDIKYHLKVADADGERARIILSSTDPIISPTWSPDGKKIAYVSFETQKPTVYIQDLITRKRILIANFKGSNSAPAWSPDGLNLALALSYNGVTQIYIININNKKLHQVTNTDGIATEPQFSPDGNFIYFTGDHGGSPQIYKINLKTGDIHRITFNGNYNISPHVSPDNKVLAYISRREGKFQLYILHLIDNQEYRLSDTDKNESPSFAPNGKYILYMIRSNMHQFLAVTFINDILTRQPFMIQIDTLKDPTWGPFTK